VLYAPNWFVPFVWYAAAPLEESAAVISGIVLLVGFSSTVISLILARRIYVRLNALRARSIAPALRLGSPLVRVNRGNFGAWMVLAGAAMIVGLGSLKNGQAFPSWMFVVYLALLIGLVLAIGAGTTPIVSLERYAAAVVGVGVLALGVGIVVTSQPTRPVTKAVTVAEVMWMDSGGEGPNHYDLLTPEGVSYELNPDDFSPPLPAGMDSPSLRGQTMVLTIDEGTTKVLAMEFNGRYYETAELSDRSWWQVRNRIYGGIIAFVGAVALAVRWWPASRRRESESRPVASSSDAEELGAAALGSLAQLAVILVAILVAFLLAILLSILFIR
jgi:hypothetical protein